MGILDEAIREHLELKRQHGADDSELKQLEDEAFGPPERPGSGEDAPDALAEAPTQFMTQPDETGEAPKGAEEQRRESAAGILDLQEAPEPTQQDEPSEEAQPAGEHEAVAEPEVAVLEPDAVAEAEAPAEAEELPVQESSEEPAGHSTEERHAIAEHPTELYDVEEEFSISAPGAEEPAPEAAEEEDDFFSEQRLSEELDQALDAPRDSEPDPLETEAPVEELEPEEALEPEASETGTPEPADDESDFDEEDGELEDEDEQPDYEEDQTELMEKPRAEEPRSKTDSEADVLEGTPDFLEQTPEDDELWFEQKPPKDFDFDD